MTEKENEVQEHMSAVKKQIEEIRKRGKSNDTLLEAFEDLQDLGRSLHEMGLDSYEHH